MAFARGDRGDLDSFAGRFGASIAASFSHELPTLLTQPALRMQAAAAAAAPTLRRAEADGLRAAIGALGIPHLGGSPAYRREYARRRRQGLLGHGGLAPGAPAISAPHSSPTPTVSPVPSSAQSTAVASMTAPHVVLGIPDTGKILGAEGKNPLDVAKTALGPKGDAMLLDAIAIGKASLPLDPRMGGKAKVDVRLGKSSISVDFNGGGGRRLERTYSKHADGTIEVHHDFFAIPSSEQGKGHASKMMAQSMAAYEKNGVHLVTTHANINVGGYAWAKQGFQAQNPEGFRNSVLYRAAHFGMPEFERNILSAAMKAEGKNAPNWLATKHPKGKELLLGESWDAVIDLRTPEGKSVSSNIQKKGKAKP